MYDISNIIRRLPEFIDVNLLPLCKNYLMTYGDITEIRLRRNRYITFSHFGENLISNVICSDLLFDNCLSLMINNSKYKYDRSLINGTIPLKHGFRVGVCGSALQESDGKIINIYSITSMNLRIPRRIDDCSTPLYELLSEIPYSKHSSLIISPPGVGKTTFLRDLALKLSSPPVSKRVCVPDYNNELFTDALPSYSLIDHLVGYPLDAAIEISTKYLCPQYIICDELDSSCGENGILKVVRSGIPIFASVHADTYEDLLAKSWTRSLLDLGIFHRLVRLLPSPDCYFKTEITDLRSVEVC